MRSTITVLLVFLSLLVAGSGMAMAQVSGIPDLTAEELQKRLGQSGTLVVDTRTAQEFTRGHIPGSVNISSQETRMFRDIARFLPQDRSTTLIFYCRGETCGLAPDAAAAAFRAGYRNVLTYRGGFPEWEQKGLPIARP